MVLKIVNPWRACAAMVTVVVFVSVCPLPNISLHEPYESLHKQYQVFSLGYT